MLAFIRSRHRSDEPPCVYENKRYPCFAPISYQNFVDFLELPSTSDAWITSTSLTTNAGSVRSRITRLAKAALIGCTAFDVYVPVGTGQVAGGSDRIKAPAKALDGVDTLNAFVAQARRQFIGAAEGRKIEADGLSVFRSSRSLYGNLFLARASKIVFTPPADDSERQASFDNGHNCFHKTPPPSVLEDPPQSYTSIIDELVDQVREDADADKHSESGDESEAEVDGHLESLPAEGPVQMPSQDGATAPGQMLEGEVLMTAPPAPVHGTSVADEEWMELNDGLPPASDRAEENLQTSHPNSASEKVCQANRLVTCFPTITCCPSLHWSRLSTDSSPRDMQDLSERECIIDEGSHEGAAERSVETGPHCDVPPNRQLMVETMAPGGRPDEPSHVSELQMDLDPPAEWGSPAVYEAATMEHIESPQPGMPEQGPDAPLPIPECRKSSPSETIGIAIVRTRVRHP